MKLLAKWLVGAALAAGAGTLPGLAAADDAADMMKSRLGTISADPVIAEAFARAAKPVTPEIRAKALECWNNNGCDTGTGGKIKVAYADGFGENVWRRVTAMEFIEQALTYPEIGHIQYSSARGDASKAIADIQAFTAQGVDVIVVFADHGKALGPAIREAKDAGIEVVLHNGTEAGTSGKDYLSNVAENICQMGKEFVKAVLVGNPNAKSIVALGGTPGNPLSASWQECAEKEAAEHPGVKIVGKFDTNWTQEGTFNAVSAALSQFGKVDGYIYEYADGFRGGVRAYETEKKPEDFVVALRTDEQGLFCDWEAADHDAFKVYYSSGQNYQARIALTAAMMGKEGKTVPAKIDVPFSMKPVHKGMCNKALPMEISVSSLVDRDTLVKMFSK
ncbi:ABC-type sugar transport system substrate-binding protein [Roseiarcus fermentans]|uniref:ABC-type sugar transport system substrate-binding protein n=1 Tax=Roseiarcus fermentans TaxID=1473586 RepID=A0A366EY24_9HYPH|nr:substrate-binding domain-containing protein [Roseiarcus fermentans]RBP07292.1 ABC-type sugar transport system substrate-binding protein [Roseiarcus fermentans]